MKPFLGIILAILISMAQVGGAFAASASQTGTLISGTVQTITLESDPTTGVVTVVVTLIDSNQVSQKVRLSQETAVALGLVALDVDGNSVINDTALGKTFEIDPTTVIPDQEKKEHPVGSALATFFSDIDGINYDTIMAAHAQGVGFGVIAQALWVTSELGENVQFFQDLIYAKQNNDYTAFKDFTEDGSVPMNWGQLRKELLAKKNLVMMMPNHHTNNGNQGNGNGNNSDKNKDKNNNGHGNGNGNNGNGNGNGHTK